MYVMDLNTWHRFVSEMSDLKWHLMKSGFRLFFQGNLTEDLEEQNIFVVYSEPTEAYPSEIQFYKQTCEDRKS